MLTNFLVFLFPSSPFFFHRGKFKIPEGWGGGCYNFQEIIPILHENYSILHLEGAFLDGRGGSFDVNRCMDCFGIKNFFSHQMAGYPIS